MITFKEALGHVLSAIVPLGLEKTDILGALGRVIGEDIRALRNIPPRDNSAMDGYALKSEDAAGAGAEHPVILNIIEDIPAGYTPQKTVGQRRSGTDHDRCSGAGWGRCRCNGRRNTV